MKTKRNPVGWFEIYVEDMARARSFYGHRRQRDRTPLDEIEAAEQDGGITGYPPDVEISLLNSIFNPAADLSGRSLEPGRP
jgi:hypothetical protein